MICGLFQKFEAQQNLEREELSPVNRKAERREARRAQRARELEREADREVTVQLRLVEE